MDLCTYFKALSSSDTFNDDLLMLLRIIHVKNLIVQNL